MDEKQLLQRAADFTIASIVEPDAARRQVWVETSSRALIDLVRLRTGAVGDFLPADAVEAARAEVMARVRDHMLAVAKTAAPAIAGLTNEDEIARVWNDALAAATPIRQ